MQHVPLMSAYVWHCPTCGKQHFGVPLVAALDDETIEIIEESFVQLDFVADAADVDQAEDAKDDRDLQSQVLISRVSILPKFVSCGDCGGKFIGMAEINEGEDDSELE